MIVKIMKYQIQYIDGCGDFSNMQKELWEIQRETRAILNRSIQILYDWDYQNELHHEQTGEYLDVLKETGYKRIDGFVYNRLVNSYTNIAANNKNVSIQAAYKKYKDSRTDVLKGDMAIPSYKKGQPIPLNQKNCKILYSNGDIIFEASMFSKTYQKEKEYGKVRFKILVCDDSQNSIITNVLSGEFGIGNSTIVYDNKKKKWFLFLTYKFQKEKTNEDLDPDKILGVDLGEKYAVYASIYNEPWFNSLAIDGGEVTAFASRIEARKKSMQQGAKYCNGGRKGHGTKTRVANVYKTRNRIANFRDTKNHIYSRQVVDYAVANHCGTIQMEDLSGIKESTGFPMILAHWTYFDLQTKIEYKAKEHGIQVKKVKPRYTSQRCSKCGCIDKANRPEQAKFKCVKCGFEANADYNAAQNLSIKDIDSIISAELEMAKNA